jgi:hypothetical protein
VNNHVTRGRKFLIAASSLVVATAFAATLEYAAFWLLVETVIDATLWKSFAVWVLGWWAGIDAGILTLYGGANLVAKWAPNPGAG